MHPDTLHFLSALLAVSDVWRTRAVLTLTAIHPDGGQRTPSRHVPLDKPDVLYDALVRLAETNRRGWGAYVGIGLRRHGLTRWQRGTEHDVLALPAVFVDLDDPSADALARLRAMSPAPSCVTFTGGGFHAYWWLDEPLSDMGLARAILRGLQRVAKSDSLSPVQSLRLVGTQNTKHGRDNALCQIVEMHDSYHHVEAFAPVLPRPTVKPQSAPVRRTTLQHSTSDTLNPTVLQAVSDRLVGMGYVQHGDWLSGPCPYPAHHQHGDRHPSFGFNMHSGYGNCFRCGSILLRDICTSLGIQPAEYGGLFVYNEKERV